MPLDKLQKALETTNDEFANPDIEYCNVRSMQTTARELERSYGTSASSFSQDKFELAIEYLTSLGPAEAIKKYGTQICYGLTRHSKVGTILESPSLFPDLFAHIQQAFAQRKLNTVAWKGLLDSYLMVSDETRTSQDSNWIELKTFLQDSLDELIESKRTSPMWLKCLSDHDNILGDTPCKRYAKGVLNRDNSDITHLKSQLQIPKESWFWSELLLRAVDQSTQEKDADFKDSIPLLFDLLKDHALIFDDCLAKILTRYSLCPDSQTAHKVLQQIAVQEWGTPQLRASAKWGKVPPNVQQMVREWIVLEDLEDFFLRLEKGSGVDKERYKYWKRFIKQIDYAHFALGKNTMESRQPDIIELREKKKDRYSIYNKREADAFFLKIGHQVFVEFSVTGNAAYGYEYSNCPFQLGGKHMFESDLKQKSSANFREAHASRWETKFDHKLAKLGIYPDGRKPTPSYPISPSLEAQLIKQGIKVIDNRPKGGVLWAFHDQSWGSLAEALKKDRFRYKPGKGYYKG